MHDKGMMSDVAPHAGAWIETDNTSFYLHKSSVAPHAGAWIETLDWLLYGRGPMSRAPRGRVD